MNQPSEEQVRALVRAALKRHLDVTPSGASAPPSEPARATTPTREGRPIIDQAAIDALEDGSTLAIPPGALVTPLARDAAMARRIQLEEGTKSRAASTAAARSSLTQPRAEGKRRIAIGADHGGVELKSTLVKHLQGEGYVVTDVGPSDTKSVDYPDYAYAVARLVSDGSVEAGIMIDGVGIGSCMAANKVPGVRASMCYDVSTARNAREHNHANYLTLGGQLIGPLLAKQIVSAWLSTPFGPDRHAKRVDKIMDIERRYLKRNRS